MARPLLTRRALLASGALAAVVAGVSARAALAAGPHPDRKLVFVILRGGLDGLAAVPPIGDPAYQRLRGKLALPAAGEANGVLPLSDGLALHPALKGLHELYGQGEAAILHAAATPYRERSHFDGQDVLESGASKVFGRDDGWLNRALQALPAPREAVAIGAAVPLVLQGSAPATSWAPNVLPGADDDTLGRLMDLYAGDPVLGPALASALELDKVASGMGMEGDGRGGRRLIDYEPVARAAGRLLAAEGGASLAVVSADGWDTHANQGAAQGALALRLAALDRALLGLKAELGAHWAKSVIIVATEFGRTVAINGTGGTDHGTAAAAFLLGGAVKGGKLLGDWPALARLHEGRDLLPVNDLRALFKGALASHWGLDRAALDARVFPDSAAVRPLDGLLA